MKAMVLKKAGAPLSIEEVPVPSPAAGQVLVKVSHCAVCRTDLHVVDGELPHPRLPLVPGHEIVGTVEKIGDGVDNLKPGDRVGVPWLGWTCGHCKWCNRGQENLCPFAGFTGYTLDGGYAEYTVSDSRFTFLLPDRYSDEEAAPLLCAGLIGYRSLRMCGDAAKIGIYGFGAAAHIIAQVAVNKGIALFGFTREGDTKAQEFARSVGCVWAGSSGESPPEKLDAAIVFAPVGELVPLALKALDRGGRLVLGGIYMTDIPAFPYIDLWQERSISSVANLTRQDAIDFLMEASAFKIEASTTPYKLEEANVALNDLREGKLTGAAVLKI